MLREKVDSLFCCYYTVCLSLDVKMIRIYTTLWIYIRLSCFSCALIRNYTCTSICVYDIFHESISISEYFKTLTGQILTQSGLIRILVSAVKEFLEKKIQKNLTLSFCHTPCSIFPYLRTNVTAKCNQVFE
jgi:hypothetical protein